MSVYVDESRYAFGRMIMCHMVADSIEELHEMADKIGIDRRHFQCSPKSAYDHYDICTSKRTEAVRLGAIEVSTRRIIEVCRAQRRRKL